MSEILSHGNRNNAVYITKGYILGEDVNSAFVRDVETATEDCKTGHIVKYSGEVGEAKAEAIAHDDTASDVFPLFVLYGVDEKINDLVRGMSRPRSATLDSLGPVSTCNLRTVECNMPFYVDADAFGSNDEELYAVTTASGANDIDLDPGSIVWTTGQYESSGVATNYGNVVKLSDIVSGHFQIVRKDDSAGIGETGIVTIVFE